MTETQYDVPQVTNYDGEAEAIANAASRLPDHISTPLAYREAVMLSEKVHNLMEGFEMSAAFKRLTGAQ